jgi:L-ascorbate 6-phosphate lactonase
MKSVERWISWVVPAERCNTVRPGDSIKNNDLEIIAVDSFDRPCLVTTDGYQDIAAFADYMDDKAVNYIIKTLAQHLPQR